MSDQIPNVQPRLLELATLAARRIALGHPVRESVLDALVAATATDRGLPASFDNLTPCMRDVVLAIYAGGKVRLGVIANAIGRSQSAAQSVCHRLVAFQVIRRCGPGLYELNHHGPTLDGLRTIGDKRRILRYLERVGHSTTHRAARDLGRHPSTMSRALRSLCIAGVIENPSRGVYRLKRTSTGERAA